MADNTSISLVEINTLVKKAIVDEFGVDVGFKTIDLETATSYIVQTAIQRIKQRTKSKEDRDTTKRLKLALEKKGIKLEDLLKK